MLVGEVRAPVRLPLAEGLVLAAVGRGQVVDAGVKEADLVTFFYEDQGVASLEDVASVAPGLIYTPSTNNTPIFTLRGIGFNTINISSTSTVGSYVDEVAYAYPFMLNGPMFDLQRVEVLKGPQGTLYGAASLGGLIFEQSPVLEIIHGATPAPAPPMPMQAIPAPMYFAAIGSMKRTPSRG